MAFFGLPKVTVLLTIYHTGFKNWTYVKSYKSELILKESCTMTD